MKSLFGKLGIKWIFVLVLIVGTLSCDKADIFDIFKQKGEVEISTGQSEANISEALTLTATTSGKFPSNICYIWDFGDGSPVDTVCNSNTVTHQYNSAGEYTVKIDIIDGETNEMLASSTMLVNIQAEGLLATVQEYLHVVFSLDADIRSDHERVHWLSIYYDTRDYPGNWLLTWEGTRFSVHIDTIINYGSEQSVSLILEGEMNAMADTVKTLYARSESYFSDTDALFWSELSIFNLPLPEYFTSFYDPHYYVDSSRVQQHIDSYSIGDYTHDDSGNLERVYSTTINWDNASNIPQLIVRFVD